MKPLQRLVWSQGMMLSPQHFQQQDLYHESLLEERVRAIPGYCWGVVSLELDARALEAGQIALAHLVAVLPSGCVLRFEAGDSEAPSARSIEGHFPAHREALEIYVGVPLERSGGVAYAQAESQRARTRYVVETRAILDATTPQEEDSVDFARRNVLLLLGEEPRDDLECIKIAEVVRDSSGRLSYAGPFCPPALRLGASSFLLEGTRSVLAACVARWRSVAEERRQRDRSSIEYGAEDVTRYLALHALGGAIPLLKHVTESAEACPLQAYLVLTELAGQLTTFAAEEDPGALPAYQHTDLRQTFEPLFAKLKSLLRVALAERLLTLALESRADGTHLGRLSDPQLVKPGVRFVLAIEAPVSESQIYELVPRVGKLASWQDIPRLVSAATAGVTLSPAPRPPREVPIRPGKFYFFVGADHPLWQGILAQRALAFHLPPPFDPRSTRVELLAIPAS